MVAPLVAAAGKELAEDIVIAVAGQLTEDAIDYTLDKAKKVIERTSNVVKEERKDDGWIKLSKNNLEETHGTNHKYKSSNKLIDETVVRFGRLMETTLAETGNVEFDREDGAGIKDATIKFTRFDKNGGHAEYLHLAMCVDEESLKNAKPGSTIEYTWRVYITKPSQDPKQKEEEVDSYSIKDIDDLGRLKHTLDRFMNDAAGKRLSPINPVIETFFSDIKIATADGILGKKRNETVQELINLKRRKDNEKYEDLSSGGIVVPALAHMAYADKLNEIARGLHVASLLDEKEIENAVTHSASTRTNAENVMCAVANFVSGTNQPLPWEQQSSKFKVVHVSPPQNDSEDRALSSEARLAYNLVRLTNKHGQYIADRVHNPKKATDGTEITKFADTNQFRIFVSCDADAPEDVKKEVYQNNVTWVKNEFIKLCPEEIYSNQESLQVIEQTFQQLKDNRALPSSGWSSNQYEYLQVFTDKLQTIPGGKDIYEKVADSLPKPPVPQLKLLDTPTKLAEFFRNLPETVKKTVAVAIMTSSAAGAMATGSIPQIPEPVLAHYQEHVATMPDTTKLFNKSTVTPNGQVLAASANQIDQKAEAQAAATIEKIAEHVEPSQEKEPETLERAFARGVQTGFTLAENAM